MITRIAFWYTSTDTGLADVAIVRNDWKAHVYKDVRREVRSMLFEIATKRGFEMRCDRFTTTFTLPGCI